MISRQNFFLMCLLVIISSAFSSQTDLELLTKKLARHVYLLKKFDFCAKYSNTAFYTFDYDGNSFNHELVLWCAKTITREQSLNALQETWKIFLLHKNNNVVDDSIFLQDFAILIFMTYKQVLIVDKVSFYDVALLYTQISQIPLGELLTLIEQSYEQLVATFSNYPYQGSIMLWLENYWWVPPVTLASFCASILQWYILGRSQRNLHKFTQ